MDEPGLSGARIGKRLLGPVNTNPIGSVALKTRQSRREERGLVIPNERRATPSGAFSGTTRRAGAVFPPSGVIIRSFSSAKPRSFCLAGQKNSPSRADWISVNRP